MARVLGLVAPCAVATGTPSCDAHPATTKVACVGDSITQFSGWCEDLGTRLGAGYTAKNFGVSGTTLLKAGDSSYWTSAQFAPSHEFAPDILVIMLGTNDSKPQNWTPANADRFAADYEELIDSYAKLASRPRIWVVLPPPSGPNVYAISGDVIEHEELPRIRQVASAKGAGVIDVFGAFGGRHFDAMLFDATDLVHPNARGARVIADAVYAALTPRGVAAEAGGSP
jgi:acyl-CoA thioesterase I